mgnify:CR=1 FL=1
MYSKLQYISQGETANEQIGNIQLALDAGCNWIQLRFKNATEEELFDVAEKVKVLCQKHEATFIINDNIELTKDIDADGVHLGLTDESPIVARNILGQGKIIGGTANTIQDVLKRAEEKCDYIGLGPFRFTSTKKQLSPILGIEGYISILTELKNKNIHIPIYAIGGVVVEDIHPLIKTGIYGIAVSGIITNHSDKKILIEQLNTQLHATT